MYIYIYTYIWGPIYWGPIYIWGPIGVLYTVYIYIEQTLILNFIFGDCSLIYCIRKDSENVKKIFLFNVPEIF